MLNENTTFDKGTIKGTWVTNSDGGFLLTPKTSESEENFAKNGDYFYRTNLICCFEEDIDYGLEVTFNDEGRTNQAFRANYDTINQANNHVRQLVLIMNEDGTFVLKDQECYLMEGKIIPTVEYTGEYRLENEILWLNYDGEDHPFIYVDGKIYFDVIAKQ